MSTDETNEQEAPGRHASETDDEDTEGHRFTSQTSDPDFDSRAPSSKASAAPDEDDTEGHIKAS